jgi:hypothetical protein
MWKLNPLAKAKPILTMREYTAASESENTSNNNTLYA